MNTAKNTDESEPLVVVVDDDDAVRFAICELMHSVGRQSLGFSTTKELLAANVLDRPGCLILDVRMPEVNGLDLQSHLAAGGTSASIIFLTGYGDIPMCVQAMKAGAVEFLTKPVRDQTLLDAADKAIHVDRQRRANNLASRNNALLYATLTPREKQVMAAVVEGALNKQIAFELGVSDVTIKLHRRSVMKKMQAPFIPHLVRSWQSIPEGVRMDYGS